jgi:L-iditol 2-dehydrogenase
MPWIVERGMEAIPPGVSQEVATFVEPVNTCLKAIHKARVAANENVLLIGQGPIGLILTALARNAGATVFASDPLPGRRSQSMRFGAVAAWDPTSCSLVDEVRRSTGGRGADVVLLAVPNPALVAISLACARAGGRVLLFAQNDPQMEIQFPAAAVGVEEKEILGSYSADVELQSESARLVFSGSLPLQELITHRFSLQEFDRALDTAARPTDASLKVVITP